MKAIAYRKGSAASDSHALYDVEIELPKPGPHDLLVRVRAVSVNPLDTKVRRGLVVVPDTVDVLGWDASGVVEAVGADVRFFKPGDLVFYAGSFHLSGSNAEFHLVDERIVGAKPKSLTFAQAAAMPLAASLDYRDGTSRSSPKAANEVIDPTAHPASGRTENH